MDAIRTRRQLLASVATIALAGCSNTDEDTAVGETPTGTGTPPSTTTGTATDTPTPTPPEECPTTQGLDVEWPEELDASAAEAFVEEYERVYYRDVVVEYDPESQLDSYGLDGSVGAVRPAGDGYVLEYSGGGGVYTPNLHLTGTAVDDPPTDPIPVSEIDDDRLQRMLGEAAETGEAELFLETHDADIDRYVDLFESFSEDVDLSGPGDSATLYVDVDGTAVELDVQADQFHGDYWWDAWYYVDERVVRRTEDDEVDPREGELLECRNVD